MVRIKKSLLALFVVALTGLLALMHGQSADSLRAQLTGTWRLVSATQRLADRTVRPDPQTGPKILLGLAERLRAPPTEKTRSEGCAASLLRTWTLWAVYLVTRFARSYASRVKGARPLHRGHAGRIRHKTAAWPGVEA